MISNSSKHHFKSFPIRGGYVEVSAKQKITLSTDKVSELNGWGRTEGVENDVTLLDFKHTCSKCNFKVSFSNLVSETTVKSFEKSAATAVAAEENFIFKKQIEFLCCFSKVQ